MNTTPAPRQSVRWATPAKSSASVKVFWLDRPQLIERLKGAAQVLSERHPEIEWIALFGSLARGTAVPGSDADLLIVVSHSTEPFLQRTVRYRPEGVGIGVDVVAYTREELAALLEAGNAFVRQALREGMVLFDSPTREADRLRRFP